MMSAGSKARRAQRAVGAAAAAAALLAAFGHPASADARNRTNEMMRPQFRQFSEGDLARYTRWSDEEDFEVLPGIVESRGGYMARADGRFQMLYSVRIYNETGVPICLRAKQHVPSGALVGRLAHSNTGGNMLIEPGDSESLVTFSSRDAVSGKFTVMVDYIAWAPNPANPARACSSVQPEWVPEWDARPASGGPDSGMSEELHAALDRLRR